MGRVRRQRKRTIGVVEIALAGMKSPRELMDQALVACAVPALRELGFKGSYPNFYREREGHVDLGCFQFSGAGGKFVVELSFAEPDRKNVYINADVPAAKLRVSQTTVRWRLGAPLEHMDNWFFFHAAESGGQSTVEQVAGNVATLLRNEGKAWWLSKHAG
jgi:hypothetical protein